MNPEETRDRVLLLNGSNERVLDDVIVLAFRKDEIKGGCALLWNTGFAETIEASVNDGATVGSGFHVEGCKSGLKKAMNEWGGIGTDLLSSDVLEGIVCVLWVGAPTAQDDVYFLGPERRKFVFLDPNLREFVDRGVQLSMAAHLRDDPGVAAQLMSKALAAKQARLESRSPRTS
jgi:DNA gyrase/topoisomerase IV subunit B